MEHLQLSLELGHGRDAKVEQRSSTAATPRSLGVICALWRWQIRPDRVCLSFDTPEPGVEVRQRRVVITVTGVRVACCAPRVAGCRRRS